MKNTIIVVGMGELGSVFARGFLKLGHPVQAVRRQDNIAEIATEIPRPEAVLIAVGEADLQNTLKTLPKQWADKTILIQNELLPKDWQTTHLIDPTVTSVWFEKKKGMDAKVVLPSPVFGPRSQLVFNALAQLDLPCLQLDSENDLSYELVRKNLYILTTNIAGLEVGGNVQTLKEQHPELLAKVANEVIALQDALTGQRNDVQQLMNGLDEAFAGDPNHQCMGRSAPARLKRALSLAEQHNLTLPKLQSIAEKLKE
ncbi:MAG: hypothetical protein COY08_04455 [Piscirickettsiaceae bacterium CG_4_10_14_0_2_um_filter_44_336]|nr:MAG: hypothetical protein COW74_06115 [Piscirickettsiaceae bacterium CG18_big_fil_WC_8_21_14_2_50_44_103]PIW57899.1 MAG: hypothetical protein COW14_03595 [Piscirickettsiaceae bacterium CG12_big_fil_rev_8_21_14_0_65_44_934]PIZ73953.1 MAG: hypothetical protein COY08_04455 [Piscirickettsiaceae bacterium CG_4_10_14_0_2_um_filter_44_336]